MTSLVEAMSVPEEVRPSLIASGGIKTPLDIVKSLALGADLVGMSNHFLQYVKDGKGIVLTTACRPLKPSNGRWLKS